MRSARRSSSSTCPPLGAASRGFAEFDMSQMCCSQIAARSPMMSILHENQFLRSLSRWRQ